MYRDAAPSTFAATGWDAGTNASAIDPNASWSHQICKTAPTLSKRGDHRGNGMIQFSFFKPQNEKAGGTPASFWCDNAQ
jgi:hypothetical protein